MNFYNFNKLLRLIIRDKDKDAIRKLYEKDSDLPTYMILRYISMRDDYLDIIVNNQLALQRLDSLNLALMLCDMLPKSNNTYIQYISKKKSKVKNNE